MTYKIFPFLFRPTHIFLLSSGLDVLCTDETKVGFIMLWGCFAVPGTVGIEYIKGMMKPED